MPNWVKNIVTLKGDESKINELLETVKDEKQGLGSIDFNKVIPMPDNIYRGALGEKERKLYGKNNWYDWSCDNWGTKWNADNCDDVSPNCIVFLTAWNTPQPIIKKLSEMFSGIEIEHRFADEDMGRGVGFRRYIGGKLVEEDLFGGEKGLRVACEIWGIDVNDYI